MNYRYIIITISLLILSTAVLNSPVMASCYWSDRYNIVENHSEQVACHKGYEVGYDADRLNPSWVMYSVEFNTPVVGRSNNFKSDPNIEYDPDGRSYVGSGYDRGHMAPSRVFYDDKQKQIESFYMSNMVPQIPNVNRGIWKAIEGRVFKLSKLNGKVDVITGPIYYSNTSQTLKNSDVQIPDAFFKIVISGDSHIGFMVPNKRTKSWYKITSFVVEISDIEKISDIKFNLRCGSSDISDPIWKTLLW